MSTEKKSVSTEQKVENTISEDSEKNTASTKKNAVITEDAAATKPLEDEKNKVVVPKKQFPQRIGTIKILNKNVLASFNSSN